MPYAVHLQALESICSKKSANYGAWIWVQIKVERNLMHLMPYGKNLKPIFLGRTAYGSY